MKAGRLANGVNKATIALAMMFYHAPAVQDGLDASDWCKVNTAAHTMCVKNSPALSILYAGDVRVIPYETLQLMAEHTCESYDNLRWHGERALAHLQAQVGCSIPDDARLKLLEALSPATIQATLGDGGPTELNRHSRLNEIGATKNAAGVRCSMHGLDLVAGRITDLGRVKQGEGECTLMEDALLQLAYQRGWQPGLVRFVRQWNVSDIIAGKHKADSETAGAKTASLCPGGDSASAEPSASVPPSDGGASGSAAQGDASAFHGG